MAKEFAQSFYNSKKWKECRRGYIGKRIMIDGGMCEQCKRMPGYIVHHTITLTPDNINDAEVSLNHKYLQYDCKECHDREEGHFYNRGQGTRPLCAFDDNGQPISLRAIDRQK